MSEHPILDGPGPLAGRTIAVTSHRRAEDLAEALERQGARTVRAATMRIVPVGEDPELVAETERLLAADPPVLLVTTGQGFTTWLDSLEPTLRERTEAWVHRSRIFCRGPKARGAVRGRGFPDAPTAPEETTASLVDVVLDAGIRDTAIGLQRHGYLDDRQLARLEEAGCTVHVVAPYRWRPGPDQDAVRDLIERTIAGEVDAITFTAGPAVEALWRTAREAGRFDALQEALRDGRCAALAVGHVTAQPLQDAGIPVLWPERERMGALVRLAVERLGRPAPEQET